MKKQKQVQAHFWTSENVSQFLTDALTFYTAIFTAPGNTHVTVSSTEIAAMRSRVADAQAAEGAISTRLRGAANTRNIKVDLVVTDVNNKVALVQIAVNSATTVALKTAVVTDCALHTRTEPTHTKGLFEVGLDTLNPAKINIVFKAAAQGERASYESWESLDNITWVFAKSSPESRYQYTHGRTTHTKLYIKGRIVLSDKKGGEQVFLIPPTAFIFVS